MLMMSHLFVESNQVTKYGDLALAKVVCHMLGEKVGAKVMGPNIGSFHYHNAYPPEESDVDYLCKGKRVCF